MTTSSNDNVEGLKGNCKKVRNKKSKIKYEKQKATYFGENFSMNHIRVFSHQLSALVLNVLYGRTRLLRLPTYSFF